MKRNSEAILPKDLNIDIDTYKRPLPANNQKQIEAMRAALERDFTLIQGPPGKYNYFL